MFMTSHDAHELESVQRPIIGRRQFMGGLLVVSAASVGHLLNPFNLKRAYADPTSAEKQAEVDEVKKKLETWAAELDKASADYFTALEAHDAAVARMGEAEAGIKAAEAEVKRLQERLNARATAMYKDGEISFLHVLFGATSFTEFATTWDILSSINAGDATLVGQSKQAKQDSQTARDEYSAQEKIAQEKQEEAEEIKIRAEETVAAAETQIASLEAEVAALLQKEKEEEERRQREAAEAAAAANNNNTGRRGDGIPKFTGGKTDIICQAAISQLGVPYRWGGSTPGVGLDCSGLTQWCYRQAGVSIGRVDTAQKNGATSVLPVSEALPGDILWRYGHVGIYMGGGAYIHAPQTGDVVRYAYNIGQFTNACRY
jgi:cell wall-associated NlpC family hydrolase